ncbi:FUSC family protein [Microbacterium aquimaris]|uniref:FUSC family protein n=1 Tax=Microbacterium aquimaris TaxID=459816 RepID=UPI002AD2975B|nr:FUSC family protein [Microbacterium aquimaris]MDZ8276612.1 FUSC family protein [Microbacterium aquimaris]
MRRHRDRLSWLAQLARLSPTAVPWDRAAMAAVGIATPVAVAIAVAPGEVSVITAGAVGSMGAMVPSLFDVGVTRRQRIRAMATVSVAATVGFTMGTVVHGHAIATLVCVIAATVLSGFASTVSTIASNAALYLLVYAITAANSDFVSGMPWAAPALFLLGGLWRIGLTALESTWRGRGFARERRAVADVYRALARVLGDGSSRRPLQPVTRAIDRAYDVLEVGRRRRSPRGPRWGALGSTMQDVPLLVDAVLGAGFRRRRARAEAALLLTTAADRLVAPRAARPDLPHLPGDRIPTDLAEQLTAVERHLDRLDLLDRGETVTPDRHREERVAARPLIPAPRIGDLRRHTLATTWVGNDVDRWILRLTLCMTLAQTLSLVLDLEQPYLVMLAVAQVMKPDLGSVFARAVQRVLGTIAGVAAGAVLVMTLPASWGVVAVAVIAALIPVVKPRNFALYSAVSLALSVMLIEVRTPVDASTLESRVMDVLLGSAIVLVVGYLPWPSTWRLEDRVAALVAQAVRSVGAFADADLRSGLTAVDRLSALRAVDRSLTDIRSLVARRLAVPGAASAARRWLPVLDAVDAVRDEVLRTHARTGGHGSARAAAHAQRAGTALTSVATAIEEHHPPAAVTPRGGWGSPLTAAIGLVAAKAAHAMTPGEGEPPDQATRRARSASTSGSVRPPDMR